MKGLLNQFLNWRSALQRLLLALTLLVLTTQLIAVPANATGVSEIPAPAAGTWVIDKAEILSRANEGKISTDLDALAKKTGFEVHFVTIHRLDYDETSQSFANQLFEQWFPTPEAQSNQALLVIDNLTNNTGIRTGEKVKEIMPDRIAKSVAQETVLIPLKEGNKYNQAFLGASDRLVAVLSGEPDPGPPELEDNVQVEGTFATPEETKSSNATFWVITFLIVATVVPMATYYFYLYLQSR
jgi:uncharacterized protein